MKPLFNIRPEQGNWTKEVDYALFSKGKSHGQWGVVRDIALQLCSSQNKRHPILKNPHSLVFTGDHGFINTYNSESVGYSTQQRVLDFLNFRDPYSDVYRDFPGGIQWVDTGIEGDLHHQVDFWIHQEKRVLDRSVHRKTKNFFFEPSLTAQDFLTGLDYGSDVISTLQSKSCKVVFLSAMGMGSDWSSEVLFAALTGETHHSNTPNSKAKLRRALQKHPKSNDAFTLVNYFAGFELVGLMGALLQAADFGMYVVIEGRVGHLAYYLSKMWYPQISKFVGLVSNTEDSIERRILELTESTSIANSLAPGFPGLAGPSVWAKLQTVLRLLNTV